MVKQNDILIENIRLNFNEFTPSQKKIANYIADNVDKTAFFTVDELASQLNVSSATIIRFTFSLGFSGYSEMQRKLREIVKAKLSPVKKIEDSIKESKGISEVSNKSIELDIKYLKNFKKYFSVESIEKAIKMIKNSENIYVVGFRTSYGAAYFLNLVINQILNNSSLLSSGNECLPESVVSFGKKDLVIAISLPRYAKKTLQIVQYAKKLQVNTIAITDSLLSPIGRLADVVLPCDFKGLTYQNTLVNIFTIINVIINCIVASLNPQEEKSIRKRVAKTENILSEWDVLYFQK